MKRKDMRLSGSTGDGHEQYKTIEIGLIRTHPTFVDLLPVLEDILENTIQDMRINGYYESEPITLGKWPGLDVAVLIDGHMRIRAAREVVITEVPFVLAEFEDEVAALQHAMKLQTKRRSTTDGAIYRLCERYDRLLEGGGDRRSEEAKSMPPRGAFEN